jgi:hypothetical protein
VLDVVMVDDVMPRACPRRDAGARVAAMMSAKGLRISALRSTNERGRQLRRPRNHVYGGRTTRLSRSGLPTFVQTIEYLLEQLGRAAFRRRGGRVLLGLNHLHDLVDHTHDPSKSTVHGVKFTNCKFVVVVEHGLAPLLWRCAPLIWSELYAGRLAMTL